MVNQNKIRMAAPALLGLTQPFSIMLSNYLFALVMIILVFTTPKREKIAWLPMLLMAIPFLIPVISLVFHGQRFDIAQLEVRIPFLVTALVLGIFAVDTDQFKEFKRGLILGVLIAGALTFLNANLLSGAFIGTPWFDLSYVPLFSVVAIIFLWYTSIEVPNTVKIVITIVLIAALILLGNVFFIIAGLLVGISAIIVKGTPMQSRVGILLVVVLGALVLYKGNQINNYLSQRHSTTVSPKNKLAQWQCVLEVMTSKELFGVGYGDKNELLMACYSEHQMTEAEANAFNAHNEYLDFLLTFGYLGVIALLVYFINAMFVAYDNKQVALLLIIILISLFALNENIFTRQKGVMLTAITYMLIYASKDYSASKEEENLAEEGTGLNITE